MLLNSTVFVHVNNAPKKKRIYVYFRRLNSRAYGAVKILLLFKVIQEHNENIEEMKREKNSRQIIIVRL